MVLIADSKLPGTYTVTVTGKSNYAGTVSKTFTINKSREKGLSDTGILMSDQIRNLIRFYRQKAIE